MPMDTKTCALCQKEVPSRRRFPKRPVLCGACAAVSTPNDEEHNIKGSRPTVNNRSHSSVHLITLANGEIVWVRA